MAKDKKSTKTALPPQADDEIKGEIIDGSPIGSDAERRPDDPTEPFVDATLERQTDPKAEPTADETDLVSKDETLEPSDLQETPEVKEADPTADLKPEPETDDAVDLEVKQETAEVSDVKDENPETPEDRGSEDAPQSKPVPPPPQSSGGFWPALFGGVLAALLGFIVGRGDMLDAYFPPADIPEPVDLSPVTNDIAALSTRLAALETAEAPELPDLSAEFGDVSQALAAIETSLGGLAARLDTVEARPVAAAPDPIVDNSEEIASLQSTVSDLETRLAEEDARASAEAQRLLAQAALTRVMTAVETGEAFEPALGALEEIAPVEVPDALRTAASEGVPSVAALRESFPEAARAALTAARAEVPESEVAGFGGFLRRQLGARSVTPREGNDPDAILSRVEAALRAGDLDNALAEAGTLPAPAQAAMQGWLDSAQARQAATAAAQSLSDSLTVN